MPLLFWYPMIVAAGLYQAASDDITSFQRVWLGGKAKE